MPRIAVLALRAIQVLAALANIILSGLVIDWYMRRTSLAPPSVFSFLLFAPVWSLLSIVYLELAQRFAPRATHPFASLALEAVNTFFYFAGFIALAVFLSKLVFCNGSVCAVGRATSVVAAAEFASWIASTILVAKDIFKGGVRKPVETPAAKQMREV